MQFISIVIYKRYCVHYNWNIYHKIQETWIIDTFFCFIYIDTRIFFIQRVHEKIEQICTVYFLIYGPCSLALDSNIRREWLCKILGWNFYVITVFLLIKKEDANNEEIDDDNRFWHILSSFQGCISFSWKVKVFLLTSSKFYIILYYVEGMRRNGLILIVFTALRITPIYRNYNINFT